VSVVYFYNTLTSISAMCTFFNANKKKKYTRCYIDDLYNTHIFLYIYICHPPAAKRITNDFDNVRLKYFRKVMYHLCIFVPSSFILLFYMPIYNKIVSIIVFRRDINIYFLSLKMSKCLKYYCPSLY